MEWNTKNWKLTNGDFLMSAALGVVLTEKSSCSCIGNRYVTGREEPKIVARLKAGSASRLRRAIRSVAMGNQWSGLLK